MRHGKNGGARERSRSPAAHGNSRNQKRRALESNPQIDVQVDNNAEHRPHTPRVLANISNERSRRRKTSGKQAEDTATSKTNDTSSQASHGNNFRVRVRVRVRVTWQQLER